MADGVFTVVARIEAAATQFSAAFETVSFAEYTDINAAPPSVVARLIGYSYNAGATATMHDVIVTLRRPGGANADEFIPLESRLAVNGGAVNQFVTMCSGDGFVVPRQFGRFGTTQPPIPAVATGETYQLFVETANKNSAATFTAWYAVR